MSGRVGTCVVAEVEVDLGTNTRDEWPVGTCVVAEVEVDLGTNTRD